MTTNHPDRTDAAADGRPLRRGFFRSLACLLGIAAAAVVALPLVGFIFGRQRRKVAWVDVGPVSGFPPGETRSVTFDNPIQTPWDGAAARTNVFVRRETEGDRRTDRFLVLAVNCAHLGCPVSWFPRSGLFMCPCHGGVYYADGERAAGPPPRGMFHCQWRVRGGKLEVQAPHFPTLQDTETSPA